MKIKKLLLKYRIEIIVLMIGAVFGSFLMFSTFHSTGQAIQISTKAWSDFASHIPLIRSFSLGSNFPPEYPLFPGEPIKYHFLFYVFVGYLEKIGIPIGFAFNIPSVLGFVFLILMIYLLAKLIFKSRTAGLLGVIFFLFNSSLSFIYYFKNNPVSIKSFLQIPNITNFQSFSPYGEGIVSAFWNLNIYTNQRHLAISFALSLAIAYLVIKPLISKKPLSSKMHIILGVILGLSFFLHTAVFLMTSVILFSIAVLFSKIRKKTFLLLIFAGVVAFPQYLYLIGSEGYYPNFVLGYLIANNLTFQKFVEFWIYNLGINIVLIPLGFIFTNRLQKKILLAFFILFIIGNLIQFSPEIAANHKFFNYFIIVGNMFSAYFLIKLWSRRKVLIKPIVVVLAFFMILGGIIDFFPIYNDKKIQLTDYKNNKDSLWILENTSPDAVFLNTTYLYNPASLAGRKIFLGWPYFAWSQGYDTNKRGEALKNILGALDKETACKLLRENKIDYIFLEKSSTDFPYSEDFWNSFPVQYISPTKDSRILKTKTICLKS